MVQGVLGCAARRRARPADFDPAHTCQPPAASRVLAAGHDDADRDHARASHRDRRPPPRRPTGRHHRGHARSGLSEHLAQRRADHVRVTVARARRARVVVCARPPRPLRHPNSARLRARDRCRRPRPQRGVAVRSAVRADRDSIAPVEAVGATGCEHHRCHVGVCVAVDHLQPRPLRCSHADEHERGLDIARRELPAVVWRPRHRWLVDRLPRRTRPADERRHGSAFCTSPPGGDQLREREQGATAKGCRGAPAASGRPLWRR